MTSTGTRSPDAAAAEIADIEQLLAPWLRVEVYSARYFGMLGTLAPYEFDTYVRAEGSPQESASALRAELLSRAERALAALEGAGWQLTSYPAMEFTGEIVVAFRQTLAGELVLPTTQGQIALRMKFAINRAR